MDSNQYRACVFSLGLVLLDMSTLEGVKGLNLCFEATERVLLKKLKIVGEIYGKELKNLLKLMLKMREEERVSMMELDDSKEIKNFLALDESKYE